MTNVWSIPMRERAAYIVIRVMRRHQRLLAVGLFLAVLLAIVQLSGLRDHFNVAFLRDLVLRHPGSGVVIFVLLFSLGNLIQIPGSIFLAAAVLTLGKLEGGAITYVHNRVAVRILRELDAHPVGSVAALRMLFQTAPAVNYALAMSGIRFRSYLIGTLIGLPLPIAAYCIFFDVLATRLGLR
jgi:uncharacterized membrane protein YdjX (TVP38/TMEM64 family)